MANESLEQLALHTIGGGWGAETEDATNNTRVSVIRGTDIPRLRVGEFSSVPVRYESSTKVKNRRLRPGDIVIEVSGGSAASGQHTGRALFVTQKMLDSLGDNVIPASFCRLLRLDAQRVNPNFIVYQIDALHLTGEIADFENQSTGIANFQFSRFAQETFPCIGDLRSQAAIAHILGTLDNKIELNRKQNETLEAMARALYKAWFVDFEPVRAKQEGRWHRDQSIPGLPAHLYDHFPDRFVESAHGEIPEGWEHTQFGSLLESTIGGDWGKEISEGDHNQVVSVIRGTDFPDISSGGIGKVPTRYTTEKKLASRQLQAGDIVLEISGGSPTQPTGRSIFISEATLDRFSNAVVCASFCRRLRPKNRGMGALAFMHLQHLYAAGGTWEYQNQSTGIANFQTTRFLESEMVAMPSAVLLEAFAAQAHSLLDKMSTNENLALVKLRDTLLPKLVSGELRVQDAERILGA
ncbi:restriction endonuclease subunit S [Pandoraea bronchicola]|uniref:Type I restriction modification DNA specificity domain-containing protein n=1 Tax=Pandoraea bronchicola TaxID=2508287 RepID=A0A5E5BWY0_9BURK|nr:restriction endonuclease subunit S [Pandoraea bronchicola]VVE90114.1 hypothetical protein PBR20603_04094 [Pandoraea bronchicola]